MADTVGPSLQRKGDHLANQDTCLAAVRALRQIIQTSGTLLKDDIHKRLHEVVLPLCVRLQQQQSCSSNACESAGSASGQYSSALTRRELYRLLLALVLVPSPCWPPPLTCAVSILSNGRTDRYACGPKWDSRWATSGGGRPRNQYAAVGAAGSLA
ncbi:proline-, glutamic acid- and leucine-rich protein 1-like [Astatotilapia calliptera]|uniref:proline-, glutamic acid- and leucine-rich protein 1-like n=1 Tax=Astatotilapia calliptera TaxID=8154 RepID=UPI0006CEC1F3|nr:proline-, glutamic acid- and leucine-rich protein 1-like [Astatotilapia calliptera]